MEKALKNKRSSNVLLLILLAGFLIFPNLILADDFQDISPEEAAKHLELPERKVENLIHSLIRVFHSKWEDLIVYGRSDENKEAVPSIMKKAVQVQALNHLLIDAPVETAWMMIKGAIKISRIVLAQDISSILDELEKETTKMAVSYGMNALFKNDIKMSPGAIEFEYKLREGGMGKALIQYVVAYKSSGKDTGKMVIRFYSPYPIKPPENKGSLGMRLGTYTELTNDLPPFIVDIYGPVEDYQWVGNPSVDIDFPPEVPDFGIKPLTFWERHLLKPIETTIKDVEIIITKVTGKSPKIVNTWEDIKKEIKSFLSKLNPFSPAGLSETLIVQDILPPAQTESVEPGNQQPTETVEDGDQRITLAEAQEIMDDIVESVDIIEQEVLVLNPVKQEEKTEEPDQTKLVEEIEELEEEILATTTDIELVEDENQQASQQESEIVWCTKSGTPTKDRVIINEIAWMGTNNSANDEWIELKNISNEEMNLSGWQILDKEDQILITFEQKILLPEEFLLLERTDDNSVPDITANLIYTGALNNSNEILYLFDDNCQLQEMVGSLTDWPYGNNSSKRTMERRSDLSWQTSANSEGTPKSKNSSGYVKYYGGGSASPPPPLSPPEEEPLESTSTPQVIITEVQIETASSTDYDFIELYNSGTTSADVSGFQLKKKVSTGSEYSVRVFPENSIVPAQGYFLWLNSEYASSTQILASVTSTQTLAQNNNIALLDNERSVIDAVAWGTSTDPFVEGTAFSQNPEENQSLGRKWSTTTETYIDTDNNLDDFEIQNPTPKTQNQSPVAPENQLPTAQFTYTPEIPLVGQEITFDASSSADSDGETASFVWNFGDNNSTTINQATTTHSYASSSDYLVELMVIDNDGATSSPATTTISIIQEETEEIPSLTIVINEIAWMGTSATNSADEWIELYNNTTSTIDIAGWTLTALDGTPSITFSTSTGTTTIPAQGFYLLERTDDQTISDISADRIYTGASRNDGEKLELKDADSNLIDIVDCSSEWFAGTTTSAYVSMERIDSNATGTDSENWANNNLIARNGLNKDGLKIYGTPKSENSISKNQTEISNSSLGFDQFEELTLTYLGSPYIVSNYLSVPIEKTLFIEPGVTIRFYIPETYGKNEGAYLKVEGSLMALGKENNEIIFTSTDTLWPGIIFESTTTESKISSHLEYVKIQRARNWTNNDHSAVRIDKKAVSIKNSSIEGYWERGIKLINSSSSIDNVELTGRGTATTTAAIDTQGGNPTIKNSYIKDNEYGIYVDLGAFPIIENNNFEDNRTPVYITYNTGLFPTIINNSGSGNQTDVISIKGEISQDSTWEKNSLPYLIRDYIKVVEGTVLTVNPGTTINFNQSTYLDIHGTLLSQGNETENISFSIYTGQVAWKRIYFSTSSQNSVIENTIISKGGAYGAQAQVYIQESLVDFRNSTSSNSFGAGIYLENSSSTISNSHFGNQPYGMKIYGSEKFPQLGEGITFENNSIYDIYIDDTATWCGSLPAYLATSTSNNCL